MLFVAVGTCTRSHEGRPVFVVCASAQTLLFGGATVAPSMLVVEAGVRKTPAFASQNTRAAGIVVESNSVSMVPGERPSVAGVVQSGYEPPGKIALIKPATVVAFFVPPADASSIRISSAAPGIAFAAKDR